MTPTERAALRAMRDDALKLLVRALPMLSDEAIIELAAKAVRAVRDEANAERTR